MADDPRKRGDPGSPDFEVEAYPFFLLNRTVGRYNAAIDSELRGIGIDIPTWRVLMVLGEQSPRPTAEVSRAAVINISTLSRLAERMKKAGLITTVPSRDDRRVTDLALTRLGESKLSEARGLTAPFYEKVIRGFSKRDFTNLLKLLNRLYDNLD
ncbi:MarR family transcriptional regulator [Pacificimonas flava]|uniref:MarR family transcriptional regulator n=2 Tax=Pacificimonas TaxID=1960290 RepID=A0A219B5F8_9SPHN|nr:MULTISPECIES: MarR family winged helix-turn-helix transcriptional regulator [Pacificimonas]MBZ6379171.1 winged helix-turn-helix transcriptional regulator [Pacificimonas aurantium]OWV33605.1 MarR family transcriptional regulator [Pacificimonas flava]